MTNVERAANEIKSIGLYDLILQDVQKLLGKDRVSVEEISLTLKEYPEIFREYKQTNVEYNLSNIHLKEIPLENIPAEYRKKAASINKNLKKLREIEKYTLDFEQSSVLVVIFSVEFFILFSVQYFIVLLNLKAYQFFIYGIFALSVVVAWQYARYQRKKYEKQRVRFEELYEETEKLFEELESKGYIDKESLWIRQSDEHI